MVLCRLSSCVFVPRSKFYMGDFLWALRLSSCVDFFYSISVRKFGMENRRFFCIRNFFRFIFIHHLRVCKYYQSFYATIFSHIRLQMRCQIYHNYHLSGKFFTSCW